MDFRSYLIEETVTVIEAMKKIDSSGKKVLFVVRKNQLVAAINDADVRRWILAKGDVNEPVSKAANYNPKYLVRGTKLQGDAMLTHLNLDGIPSVNEQMEVLDVFFRISQQLSTGKSEINVPVVIMAGGKGTRLYPYTQVLPKPLIPIGEKSITEHIMDQFQHFGCHQFYMIVNYKKNMIKAYFNEEEQDKYQIDFIDESVFLGTGGGVLLLKGKVEETFILSNCDILLTVDFHEIYQFHKTNGNMITMVCAMKQFEVPYGVVHLGETGQLKEIQEKPNFPFLTNTGCYIVEPEVIDSLVEGEEIGFPDVMTRLQNRGEKVGVFPVGEESWMDMGQLEEMEKMSKKLGFS